MTRNRVYKEKKKIEKSQTIRKGKTNFNMNIVIAIAISLIIIVTAIYKHVHPKQVSYYNVRSHQGRFKATVTKKPSIRTLSNKPMKINYYKTDTVCPIDK